MDKDRLATNIVNALKPGNAEITGAAETALLAKWKLIADEIIKEIKNNGQVTVSGVTPGGASATGSVS